MSCVMMGYVGKSMTAAGGRVGPISQTARPTRAQKRHGIRISTTTQLNKSCWRKSCATLRVPQRYIEILRAESGQKLGRAHRSMAVLASRASLSCQQQAPVVEGHGGVGRVWQRRACGADESGKPCGSSAVSSRCYNALKNTCCSIANLASAESTMGCLTSPPGPIEQPRLAPTARPPLRLSPPCSTLDESKDLSWGQGNSSPPPPWARGPTATRSWILRLLCPTRPAPCSPHLSWPDWHTTGAHH